MDIIKAKQSIKIWKSLILIYNYLVVANWNWDWDG